MDAEDKTEQKLLRFWSCAYCTALAVLVVLWFVCLRKGPQQVAGRQESPGPGRVSAQAVDRPERPQEGFENDLIQAALLEKANRIDDCTITFYSNDTCGKQPGDKAYGITASGLPTVEGVTCATDWSVIPKYSDVFIQFQSGEIRQLWATDRGVTGNHVDVYLESYDDCIQSGRQTAAVYYIPPEGASQ